MLNVQSSMARLSLCCVVSNPTVCYAIYHICISVNIVGNSIFVRNFGRINVIVSGSTFSLCPDPTKSSYETPGLCRHGPEFSENTVNVLFY